MRISRPPHHILCGRRKVHGGSVLTEEVHPEIDVLSLKALIEDTSGIAMSEQRILYKGRALRDEVTLEEAGVIEDSQLYVAMDSGVNAASVNVDASAFVPQPGQQPANNDPMAAMLNNPLVSSMLDNPEVLRTMIQANPQMRQMMEDNPELAQIMNDPAAETGLVRNPSIEDALNDVHARYRPHIAFFEGEVNHAADELEPIAKQVRSALVKSKELAGGFVAHDLALVEHGATYGERTEVARFPLRYGDLRD